MATGRVPTTANSPLTAKGDLFGYSTTSARVAVGNDGDTLLADSSTSTGLRWSAGYSLANPVINGGFDIWQRGTSTAFASSVSNYISDRWVGYSTNTGTYTRQATGDTTNLPNIQYCARAQRTNATTGTDWIYLAQSIENVNSIPFAGKTVTISFYARAGANFSAASSQLGITLLSGTGTDQNVLSTWTGSATVVGSNATLTTTWQRFTYSGSVGSTATQLGLYFGYKGVGTAGAADYFEVTGVQIDVGSTALPFRRSGGTLQGELAACQRYYYRKGAADSYQIFSSGFCNATTNSPNNFVAITQMRTKPSSIDYGGSIQFIDSAGSTYSVSSLTLDSGFQSPTTFYVSAAATGMTVGRFGFLRANNDTTAYVGFSAEL